MTRPALASLPRGAEAAVEATHVVDPGQPIIDAHHHLYERADLRYLEEEYAADLRSGHDVRASVFVQARGFYRTGGEVPLRPVGETDYAAGVADRHAGRSGPRICAAIVGFADLLSGSDIRPVLEAHLRAGRGHFRGLRHILAWDRDSSLLNPAYPTTEDMTETAAFRAGFAELAALGLRFDAWLYFHQIPRLTALARAFPDVSIALDHCGGILGIGPYSGKRNEVRAAWRVAMAELSSCPNVSVKLGGLGMPICGMSSESPDRRPTATELAAAWRPWVQECVELFGPRRCMAESNSPADKPSYDYRTGWNALKLVLAEVSGDERNAIYCGTAARFYGIRSADASLLAEVSQ